MPRCICSHESDTQLYLGARPYVRTAVRAGGSVGRAERADRWMGGPNMSVARLAGLVGWKEELKSNPLYVSLARSVSLRSLSPASLARHACMIVGPIYASIRRKLHRIRSVDGPNHLAGDGLGAATLALSESRRARGCKASRHHPIRLSHHDACGPRGVVKSVGVG